MFPKALDQGTLLSGIPVMRPENCVLWVIVAHTGV